MAYSLRYPVGIGTLLAVIALILTLNIAVPVTQKVATRIDDVVAEQVLGSASETTKFLSQVYTVAIAVAVVAAVIPSPVQPIAWAILGGSSLGVLSWSGTALVAACVGRGPCG